MNFDWILDFEKSFKEHFCVKWSIWTVGSNINVTSNINVKLGSIINVKFSGFDNSLGAVWDLSFIQGYMLVFIGEVS